MTPTLNASNGPTDGPTDGCGSRVISGNLTWQCLAFDQLTLAQLYAALQLRAEVFVVEQACAFQDLDGVDAACHHLLGWGRPNATNAAATASNGPPTLLACARLVPAGVNCAEASIGRVVTSPVARGQALGHALVAQACQALVALWGAQPIRIGAQSHLQPFYAQHGFATASEPYVEDGIWHVEMLKPAG